MSMHTGQEAKGGWFDVRRHLGDVVERDLGSVNLVLVQVDTAVTLPSRPISR